VLLEEREEVKCVLVVAGVSCVDAVDQSGDNGGVALPKDCGQVEQFGQVKQPQVVEQLLLGRSLGLADAAVYQQHCLQKLRVDFELRVLLLQRLHGSEVVVAIVATARQHSQAALEGDSHSLILLEFLPKLLLAHAEEEVEITGDGRECYFVLGLLESGQVGTIKGISRDEGLILVSAVESGTQGLLPAASLLGPVL
jgi:hypothetical protein